MSKVKNYYHDEICNRPEELEPDYLTRFDMPIVLPDYEKWSKEQEMTTEQLDEMVNDYENRRPF